MSPSQSLPATLEAWLAYIEGLHHAPIELGLERVRAVAQRLALELPGIKLVVGGTNGKGSTCAFLDFILRAAGYRVGRYGSPHLLRFNERAFVDGLAVRDEALLPHLAAVEQARAQISLTYFEFTTLAVLRWFAHERIDVAVLEVGLGGRLDAVNIIDADCAVVTSIDLDHTELLGPTREHIGAEKAPIFRAGRPAICVDPDPPASLLDYAARIGADLWRYGRDFAAAASDGTPRQWTYRGRRQQRAALPWPALRGAHQLRNAAGALAAIEALAPELVVDQQAVRQGLTSAQLPGRFQVVPGRPAVILDVAHNAHAARALAQALAEHALPGARTYAVFGMLRDKDCAAVVAALRPSVERWHLVPTGGARGLPAAQLQAAAFAADERARSACFASVGAALEAALGAARSADDRIVVFGTFLVVADALRWLELRSR